MNEKKRRKIKNRLYVQKSAGDMNINNGFFNMTMGTGGLTESMQITQRAVDFLLVDKRSEFQKNDFQGIYDSIKGYSILTAQVTEALYLTGVDPLPYMTKIPTRFAFMCSMEELHVPEGIVSIGSKAFARSSIKELWLPHTLNELAPDAFDSSYSLDIIHYNGKKYEWRKFSYQLDDDWSKWTSCKEVICTDGSFVLKKPLTEESEKDTYIYKGYAQTRGMSGIVDITTQAVSLAQAINNIKYRVRQQFGLVSNVPVTIETDKIKLVKEQQKDTKPIVQKKEPEAQQLQMKF